MFLPRLVPARFIKRHNRFLAAVRVNGERDWAHVPNSGRLAELFVAGRRVWLTPAARAGRKTPYDLTLVELDSGLVSADARLPNKLFAEALRAGRLAGFPYKQVEVEVGYKRSRLDFRLSNPQVSSSPYKPGPSTAQVPGIQDYDEVCWVETKSVTLVEAGVALFPDVPTSRGSRHLRELIELKKQGKRAAVVFIIQRADARAFAAHQTADPYFARTLQTAVNAGVEVWAYTCEVTLSAIRIKGLVPLVNWD